MTNQVLITEDLTKSFGDFTAIDRLNLKINQNTCVGFLGPNGAGKTTTIKILLGLLRPSSGTAFIENIDITKDLRLALSKVGAIVETPEFYPNLTPNEILSFFGLLRGIKKNELEQKIDHVLETVRLEDWKKKKVGKFSKGMKQRLCLASSLLHDPSILLLDEPTSGLDPRGAAEVREIIVSLKNSGKTIFMSSHILSEVQAVCDDIALLDKGKLIRFEKIEKFSAEAGNSMLEIKILESITEQQLSLIRNFSGISDVKIQNKSTIILQYEGTLDGRANFLKKLNEMDLKITSFKNVSTELESSYMDQISDSVR